MWYLTGDPGAYFMAAVVLISCVALSILCVLVVRRFLPWLHFDRATTDFGQIFGGAIGTMFALVFALVTIAVWQNYDRVGNGVGEEANCIHNLYRSLESYPPEMRDPTRALLREYLKAVIDQEWPLMTEGQQDKAAHRIITDVNARIAAFRPSASEAPLHSEVLHLLSKYRGLRHDRVRSGGVYLDTCMWISLVVGSLILFGFCGAWRMPDYRQHLFMAAALGASLGIIFYLMLAYNHPFQGPGAIAPTPFKVLLENHWT